MPRVSYVAPPADLSARFAKNSAPLTKVPNSSRRYIGRNYSRREKNNLRDRSLLGQIGGLWRDLSSNERAAWTAAGYAQGISGWHSFLQDTAYRLKNSLSGLATPSELHQYKVGHIEVGSSDNGLKIVQAHPHSYYKISKVAGTKSQRVPALITENLTLPLEISCSYRSNLTEVGGDAIVKFYAIVNSLYKGGDIPNEVGFDVPLVSDWAAQTATLSAVVGLANSYSLFFELVNVSGVFEFDLVVAAHSGSNYARDFRCDSVALGYSNLNFQLPPDWAPTQAFSGATLESVYPSDSDL